MPEPILPPARREQSDVTARAAAVAFPAMLLTLLAIIFLARWLFPGAAIDRRLGAQLPIYPSPRLQVDPAADMQHFLATELARLNSRGWDDRSKGQGHIPIDEAMQRIAASGIPDWPK